MDTGEIAMILECKKCGYKHKFAEPYTEPEITWYSASCSECNKPDPRAVRLNDLFKQYAIEGIMEITLRDSGDAKRIKKITSRLRSGCTEEQIRNALYAFANDEWEERESYFDVCKYVLVSDEKVDEWTRKAPEGEQTDRGPGYVDPNTGEWRSF